MLFFAIVLLPVVIIAAAVCLAVYPEDKSNDADIEIHIRFEDDGKD